MPHLQKDSRVPAKHGGRVGSACARYRRPAHATRFGEGGGYHVQRLWNQESQEELALSWCAVPSVQQFQYRRGASD